MPGFLNEVLIRGIAREQVPPMFGRVSVGPPWTPGQEVPSNVVSSLLTAEGQVPYFDLVLVCRAKPGFPSHWGKVPNFLGSIPNFSGILPTTRLPQTSKKTQPGNGFG